MSHPGVPRLHPLSSRPTLANARSSFNLAPNLHSVSARLADCSLDAQVWTRDGVLATHSRGRVLRIVFCFLRFLLALNYFRAAFGSTWRAERFVGWNSGFLRLHLILPSVRVGSHHEPKRNACYGWDIGDSAPCRLRRSPHRTHNKRDGEQHKPGAKRDGKRHEHRRFLPRERPSNTHQRSHSALYVPLRRAGTSAGAQLGLFLGSAAGFWNRRHELESRGRSRL